MKITVMACVLFTLTGCASLLPTAVNPGLTCANNNLMALIAAQSGDCSVPLCVTSASGACANLPLTSTTVQSNINQLVTCAETEGAGNRMNAAVAGIKTQLCFNQQQPVPAAPTTSTTVVKP